MRPLIPISVLLIGLAVVTGDAAPAPAAPSQASEVTVAATADAHVSASARRRNFGGARSLLVRRRPVTRAYFQFDLSELRGPVARATLVVYSLHRSTRNIRVHTSAAGWKERRITFANAPRPRGTVGTARAGRGRLTIDVTRGVRMGSVVSLAVSAAGRGALRLASREAGSARRPRLIVEQTPQILVAAGDIATSGNGDEQTAALLDQIPGTVAALGDLAYENGSSAEFAAYYAPTWGRHYARTRPAPGNHEYQTPGAAGYFAYWGSIGGDPTKGYYSYDLGAWHMLSVNSNCDFIGGCSVGSTQERWVRADLAAHPARCTLAYWHHPRFSGGSVGSSVMMQAIWDALYDHGADLVLVGHAHNYQRFAPMTAAGGLDTKRGLREFVVGTGGNGTFHATGPATNLEASNVGTWGVLKLTLNAVGYDWQFVPVAGATFTDSGSAACH